ncbi:MAG: type IV secretion system DNA-binding domain-containing protein [Chloroflexi bacterium]|nr:type IV secretion system DNA-binding domain-containing protein [Chloroflexota bacterium]
MIYLDPARRDYLIPFNVLSTGQPPYATAMNVIEALRRTWPESLREAPRFTNLMLAALLVLIANQLTLVELPRLLTDQPFRETLLDRADDPELTSVFHERLDKWGRERALILESILNKVSAFALNPSLRLMLGQRENRLDFRRMMDEGQVLIVNLGHCDGETRRLLGSLITTLVEQATLARASLPAQTRRPFYFYLDEFQDFCANASSTTTLAQVLSESRKFGLHLTLAHQTLGQLLGERLRAALGNIGTKVVFQVDRVDAEMLAPKLFVAGGEQVKHEVEDEAHQPRSHPIYYALTEEWEQAIRALQHLPPRTCWVKRPGRGVVKLHTITMLQARQSGDALEQLVRGLARQSGEACEVLERTLDQRWAAPTSEPTTYYEPIPPPVVSPTIKRLTITTASLEEMRRR